MKRLEYFAAANSECGFYNMFDSIFSKVDKIYIIKGGPGTGKSSLMRKIGTVARHKQCPIELIYCSSDPSSLDGIIIENGGKRYAVADGTAPHLIDTKLPGLRDEIINLCDNWNTEMIEAHGERIKTLNKYKNACWERAYAYLAAAGQCERSADNAISPCIDHTAVSDCADKIAEKQKKAADAEGICDSHSSIIGNSYGMHGEVTLDCFGDSVTAYHPVVSYYGTGREFLHRLAMRSYEADIPIIEIKYPLIPEKTDGVFFCSTGVLYRIDDGRKLEEKRISMRSAVNAIAFRGVRGSVRFALEQSRKLKLGALGELDRAGEYHAELESIYKSAMDFEKNNVLCTQLCERIGLL